MTYRRYFNGCDGAGADCTNPNCPTAFHVSTDTNVQVPCQINNVSCDIPSERLKFISYTQ